MKKIALVITFLGLFSTGHSVAMVSKPSSILDRVDLLEILKNGFQQNEKIVKLSNEELEEFNAMIMEFDFPRDFWKTER